MRIVLVNWAHVWDGASRGGGVNGYAQGLALALRDLGHEVAWLSSGLTYTGEATRVVRHPDWLGLRVFEVIDSPVLAPSVAQFADPTPEGFAPELERVVRAFLERLRPEVVHFHNVEGFSAGCVIAAGTATPSWPGARVVWSLHNYHPVCPQVYLLRGHRTACGSACNGHACARCIEASDPAGERARRVRERVPPAAAAQGSAEPANSRGRWRTRGASANPAAAPVEATWLDAMASGALAGAMPLHEDRRGRTPTLVAEGKPRSLIAPESPEWAPMTNEIAPEPPEARAPNEYGVRRTRMVAALNSCDRVLAVSRFVRDKYASLGVREDGLVTLPIGTNAGAIAARHSELVFDPPAGERAVRAVFMGYNNWYKGLPMLADALELIAPDYLSRLHLFVYALDGHSIEWRFRRLEPRLAALTVHHGYEPHDVPWMLGGKDVGLVASVWWDNAPQTVLEYQANGLPVIAPALGGIPEMVRDEEDGLLFRGNDRYDLARTLARVIRDRGLLARLRAGVRSPKAMPEHALELEHLYEECVSCPRRAGAPNASPPTPASPPPGR